MRSNFLYLISKCSNWLAQINTAALTLSLARPFAPLVVQLTDLKLRLITIKKTSISLKQSNLFGRLCSDLDEERQQK